MLGEQKGAVKELQTYLVNAIRCPSKNHSLNLSISKCSAVQLIRNAVWIISEIIALFNASSKRSFVLKQINQVKLKSLCDTRWIDRHDAVILFKSSFKNIIECLEHIAEWHESESSSRAECFKTSILTLNFLVSLYCLCEVLSITFNASKILQAKAISRQYAANLIQSIIETLRDRRQNATRHFHVIFEEIRNIASELGASIILPRITKSQVHRSNPECNDREDYYRITVFIPLLDNIIEDLCSWFNDNKF